ncbi:MAG: hypothetical protein K5637_06240 [Lachnospiraceae bacterium]|nr:hypothetical protein [Lachnospiraceae bacterium]
MARSISDYTLSDDRSKLTFRLGYSEKDKKREEAYLAELNTEMQQLAREKADKWLASPYFLEIYHAVKPQMINSLQSSNDPGVRIFTNKYLPENGGGTLPSSGVFGNVDRFFDNAERFAHRRLYNYAIYTLSDNKRMTLCQSEGLLMALEKAFADDPEVQTRLHTGNVRGKIIRKEGSYINRVSRLSEYFYFPGELELVKTKETVSAPKAPKPAEPTFLDL